MKTSVKDDFKNPNKVYKERLAAYKDSLGDAFSTSRSGEGIAAGERRYWSSVLLVRICSIGLSLLRLCPDDQRPDSMNHWDFASVGSLARNLFECAMFFLYFSTPVGEEEWLLRLNLMQLHDCTERIRMFSVAENQEEVKGFELHAIDLRQRIQSNPFFGTLDPKFGKHLLQGHRASLFSLNELVSSFVKNPKIWSVYQLLSSHAHSLSLSFYRTSEQKRVGIENEVDKFYIGIALSMSQDMLDRAVKAYRFDFTELCTFKALGSVPYNILPLSAPQQQITIGSTSGRNALCPCGSGRKFRWCHGIGE